MLLPPLSLPIAGLLLAFVVHGAAVALLLRPGHGRQLARAVGLACAFTSLGAVASVLIQPGTGGLARLPGLLDALRFAAWLNVLRVIAVSPATGMVRAGWGACGAFALVILLVPAPELAVAMRAGGLLLTLVLLAVLASLWLGAGTAPREILAPLLAGIGVPLGFEVAVHAFDSHSLAGLAWLAVLETVSLPLVLIGIRRITATAPLAFVSRQVVLFTLALVAVAAYVALTALAASAIAETFADADGSPAHWHEIAFLSAAAVLFGVLCAAPSVRRRVGVFVATHFYRNKYDYRLEWLRFIQTLSSGAASAAPSTSILAVAQMFGSPAGALYAREESTGRFERRAVWPLKMAVGDLPETLAADDALPGFLGERQWVIDMAEFARDPRSHAGLIPPAWLERGSRWGIVTPLLQLDTLVGFMVLAAPPPPFRMNFEDRDLFKTVGRHIALLLTQQGALRRLAESRQFDAYNRFAAFVMHDLKNSVAQLQLVVQNAARHRHNPQFIDDAISTTANTVDRMTGLIAQLQSRDVHGHVSDVPLSPLVGAAAARAGERLPAPAFEDAGGGPVVRADAQKLGAVLDHVIRNAQEATGETGQVRIRLESVDGRARLVVRDDGPGMDEEFVRESLFRPFHTTKGSKGMGIGAYQAREYVHSLGGSIEVQSSPGRGTAFCITLPLCQTPNPDC
jgi:putative PEP-CTERM system histidine kinase